MNPIECQEMQKYHEFESDDIPGPFSNDHGIVGIGFLGDIHIV